MRFAAALIVTAALAQAPLDRRIAAGFNAIRASNMRADLVFLSSDALEGRRSMHRGSDVAAEFVASQFARAGLKPLEDGSYLQTVPLVEYRGDRERTRLTLERGGKVRTFEFSKEYTGGFPSDITAAGPVVFAGYGITAPELKYDDYAGLDAKGKIVLIFDHEPQENNAKSPFNGRGNTRYAGPYLKTLIAQRHGAVGVLVMLEPNRKHLTSQERSARVPGSSRRSRFAPQALAEGELSIPLFTLVDGSAAEILGGSPAELQNAIDARLKPASKELPDTRVEMRVVNSERNIGKTVNVIGMIEGSDPALRRETILFTSHYDHLGAYDEKTVFHGADDNGSGTVGIIELARAFAANPVKPKRTLMFISFGAEEAGLLGSYYYTMHPVRPLETTRAVINLDMVGHDEMPSRQTEGFMQIAPDTSNETNLIGTFQSPDYRAAVERQNKITGLKINYKWEADSAMNVLFRCDHFPFLLRGIPSVWWFNGFHPDYHQTSDTVDKINFPKMEKIIRLAYLTGWEFADGKPPRFSERPVKPD